MGHVLGLDGGGTKTDVVVADHNGTVIARLHGEGLDPTQGEHWEAMLAATAEQAGPVKAAVLGLPFHSEIAAVSARQSAIAARLFGVDSCVVNDVAVAFEGAFAGGDGVLLLAGTGSMAWSRGPLGVHRVGGWGDAFGDEGSAYWIGREALARISQELDGRSPTSGFATVLLGRMGIAAGDLIGWTYRVKNPRTGIAGLAATVSDLAQGGSAEAVAIMAAASDCLALHGLTAMRLCGTARPAAWSFAGGVFNDTSLRDGLTAAMGCAPTPPVLPPVGGAVLMAAKAAGWDTGPDVIARLAAGLTK